VTGFAGTEGPDTRRGPPVPVYAATTLPGPTDGRRRAANGEGRRATKDAFPRGRI
jgi:hypothetical protein